MHKGIYQSKIIQKVVNGMWFCNKQDEGVVHEEIFNLLTIEAEFPGGLRQQLTMFNFRHVYSHVT